MSYLEETTEKNNLWKIQWPVLYIDDPDNIPVTGKTANHCVSLLHSSKYTNLVHVVCYLPMPKILFDKWNHEESCYLSYREKKN